MKISSLKILALCAFLFGAFGASAQFNLGKLGSAGEKILESLTLSDAQVAAYVKESVEKMDSENKVLPESDPYSQRLAKLTSSIKEVEGIPLNFKVYKTDEINAFACPDGSVRVYTGIMDLLNDNELLGVIGHEVGHVAKHHSRKAMQATLRNSALQDAVSSAGGTVAKLTESQLGALTQTFANAKYSQKQEKEADEYGYQFLVINKVNPWGIVSAFEKMQSLEGAAAQSGYITKMFSSHPDTASRIKNMTKKCVKSGYERP